MKRFSRQSLFPTYEEVCLIKVLGGTILTIRRIRDKETHRPLRIVVRQPRILKREHFRRTGDTLVLFSNDLKMGLAVEGREYERDVVAAYERDEFLQSMGWRIRYIRAYDLFHRPEIAKRSILQFLNG